MRYSVRRAAVAATRGVIAVRDAPAPAGACRLYRRRAFYYIEPTVTRTDLIPHLAEALQRGDLLPWAVVPPDGLPAAWRHCDDGVSMATIIAHVLPDAFPDVMLFAADTLFELPRGPAREMAGTLNATASVHQVVSPAAAVRELRHAVSRSAPATLAALQRALRDAAVGAIPALSSRVVVEAVTAR